MKAHLEGTQVSLACKDTDLKKRLYLSILDVLSFLDPKKGMSEEDASMTLKMLLQEFYYFKYEEFLLVFRKMKEGDFGNFYERIKAAEFKECFRKYDVSEERSLMWENLHKSKKIDTLPEITTQMYDEAVERMKEEAKRKVSDQDAERFYQELKMKYNNKNTPQ